MIAFGMKSFICSTLTIVWFVGSRHEYQRNCKEKYFTEEMKYQTVQRFVSSSSCSGFCLSISLCCSRSWILFTREKNYSQIPYNHFYIGDKCRCCEVWGRMYAVCRIAFNALRCCCTFILPVWAIFWVINKRV